MRIRSQSLFVDEENDNKDPGNEVDEELTVQAPVVFSVSRRYGFTAVILKSAGPLMAVKLRTEFPFIACNNNYSLACVLHNLLYSEITFILF